jgi:hypothetical protein
MIFHRGRLLACVVAAICLALGGGAAPGHAMPVDPYPRPAPVHQRVIDAPGARARPVTAARIGDTQVDDPGSSRAPKYDPPATIVVNRPTRTIVRNVDESLPIALSGAALLLALAGVALVLARGRIVPRV